MGFRYRFESEVARPARNAWASATSVEGIGAELPRVLRLRTDPPVATLRELLAVGGSIRVVLAIGPAPLVRWTANAVTLDEADMRFVESSTDMTGLRLWRHERRVEPLGPGRCRVVDVVSGVVRIPFAGLLVAAMFRGRHRRLRRVS